MRHIVFAQGELGMKNLLRKLFVILFIVSLILLHTESVEAAKISKKNIEYLNSFVVGDMWNDCICNFNWYYEYRTDSVGNEMNPEETLAKFNKVMKKAKKWDKVVKSLKGKKYKKLKKHWKAAYSEAKKIQKKLNKADFNAMRLSDKSYKLNCDKFEKYMYKIMEDFY